VLGVGISAVTMIEAVAAIEGWAASGPARYVTVTGVHGVMECQDDAELRRIHNDADLVVPDGMPMVWLSKRAGHRHTERVYGPDLMLELFARSGTSGCRHYLFGGADGVPELLARRLGERFPEARIVGSHSPPFRPLTAAEEADAVAAIEAVDADIIWIGLSTPKQERLMERLAPRMRRGVLIGVGAAFDFHAGLKPQAPRWMQRSGLEWAYRMLTEPRRLARRYMRNNPRFIWAVLLQACGIRRHDLPQPGRSPRMRT
jgi:N-acetylglucosaminyldiphosphoundecaprenol N-acetyl-beta-D-mannosaminyltransferase